MILSDKILNPFKKNYASFSWFVFNAKEKDYESGFHYYGSRYYSSELSIWNSTDPMADKYPSLTPYNYCANNPVKLIDPNGEEGVAIVDKNNKNITISAIYYVKTNNSNLCKNIKDSQLNYTIKEVSKIERQVNEELNNSRYKVTEGEYSDYNVKFDLKFIVSDGDHYLDQYKQAKYNDIPIGNTFEKSTEDNIHLTRRRGGVTLDHKNIIMNSKHDFKRNRIHEIFHTLFFDNDDANAGIGNYSPGNDMPNQSDINKLINNKTLKKIEE